MSRITAIFILTIIFTSFIRVFFNETKLFYYIKEDTVKFVTFFAFRN